jgi:hypothetical protein
VERDKTCQHYFSIFEAVDFGECRRLLAAVARACREISPKKQGTRELPREFPFTAL